MQERMYGHKAAMHDDPPQAVGGAAGAGIALAFLQHVAATATQGLTPDAVAEELLRRRDPQLRQAVVEEIGARWGGDGVRALFEAEQRIRAASPAVATNSASSTHTTPAAPTLVGATPAPTSTHGTPAPTLAHPTPIATASLGHRSALDRALALTQLGVAHLEAIRAELVPAYRKAVAAMDTAAVKALALQIVGGVARIVDAQAHVVRLVPLVDTSPQAAKASTAETDPGAPDPGELATLTARKTALDAAVATMVPALAVQVSPQWFGDELVAGRAPEPAPHVREVLVQLTYEAGLVVQLLEEADAIEALIRPMDKARGTSDPATEGARREAVGHLEKWKGRPINFLFLARVLTRRGVWQSMQGAQDTNGHTAADLERKVTAQSRETGTTADVGESWDADEAHRLLSYGTLDWKITDAEASRVFEMLAKAEPRARGELVKQLYRMGRLGDLCEHLPWGLVKQLWESIPDAEASKLLEPYWADKGGGKSLGKRLEEQDHWYTSALNRFLDIATFGAKPRIDAAYDAREAGLITGDDYWGSVTKAVGRAAFVAAATAATGGAAGELVAGASEGMGLMAGEGLTATIARGATTVASSATAGGVGNVAGHFVGDLYDQTLDGKEGFDSLSSYGGSFKEGVMFGAATAAVGLAASKFIPGAMRTLAQDAAAAHPQLTQLLEAARSVGVRASVRVRMTVEKYLETIGGGPRGLRFAYAGAPVLPRIAAAPREAPLWVTVRPLKDLNAPMRMQAHEGDDLVEVENVELESGSLFDSYGDDASCQDEHAGSEASHADEHIDEIGTAEPDTGGKLGTRRVRNVRAGEMDPRMQADQGMSVLDEARLGIGRPPRHHTLPQEEISFFQERGFPGRDIDNFTVELDTLDHEMVHGGNQSLARKHWRGREWNTELMRRLREREAVLQRRLGPQAKLSRDAILKVMEQMRKEFEIDHLPFVPYNSP